MANMEGSKVHQLPSTATRLVALKQSQPLMEAPVLPAEAIGGLKITLWRQSI